MEVRDPFSSAKRNSSRIMLKREDFVSYHILFKNCYLPEIMNRKALAGQENKKCTVHL